jgi:EmrB/QacA subfamily drug resistance transporter
MQATASGALPLRGERPARRRLVLIACILGSGIAFLDGTVVNVALPAIRTDLHAGLSLQQWVVEAYLLTLGSLLLIGGSLGDLFGRRRVFALGVGSFGITSLLCAVAPTSEVLIGARALQGVAAALLVPSTMGVIVTTFDESERGRAIGSWTAWTGIATVVGPLAGGALVQAASWRWVFLINLPLAAVTLGLIAHAMSPDVPLRRRPRVDVKGAALCALGLAGPVFALIEQPRHGWADPVILVPLIAGTGLLGAFVAVERRERDPMLPLALFGRRNFTAGNLATFSLYAGLGLPFFFLILFLQQVAGYRPVEAGLALLPVTALMFALSKRFGALADRFGPHWFMTLGPIVAGAGLALLLRVDRSASYLSELLPALVVFGLGLSATVAPLTATVLGGVEPEHAGVASAINNAIARVAGLLSVAVVGVLVSSQFASTLDARLIGRPLSAPARTFLSAAETRPLAAGAPSGLGGAEGAAVARALDAASVDAFRLSIGLAAALVAAGGLISLIGVRDPRRAVPAAECPGGAICGGPKPAGQPPGHPLPSVRVRLPASG